MDLLFVTWTERHVFLLYLWSCPFSSRQHETTQGRSHFTSSSWVVRPKMSLTCPVSLLAALVKLPEEDSGDRCSFEWPCRILFFQILDGIMFRNVEFCMLLVSYLGVMSQAAGGLQTTTKLLWISSTNTEYDVMCCTISATFQRHGFLLKFLIFSHLHTQLTMKAEHRYVRLPMLKGS